MSDSVTLHSRFNRWMAVALWVLAALLLLMAITGDDPRLLPLYPGAALVALFAWTALWQPCVRVDAEGVLLRNVTHRVLVPWEALIHVDTRYALTLHTPNGTFAAWAAPAPGFLTAMRAGRSSANREARAAGEALRAGDMLGTESGAAATVVREQWRRRLDSGEVASGMAGETLVQRQWNAPMIAGLALLVAATLWALAATGG